MKFLEMLGKKKVIIFDGAIGTEMARRGLDTGAGVNLTNPEAIESLHKDYASLGIDCLITNSFIMNRISMESKKMDVDIRAVNLAAVKLARSAANDNQYVFGDIGPSGKLLEPYGDYSEDQFYENFKEQALILKEGKVDGIIIETMTDMREAICALKAVKDNVDLPVIVSLSFTSAEKGGRTMMGNNLEEIAKALEKNGADVVGANCGELVPLDMARLAAIYKEYTDLPVLIQPNAGLPRLVNGNTVYEMTPQDFADGVAECINNGAMLVGGCCGTTVEHIRAVVEKVKEL